MNIQFGRFPKLGGTILGGVLIIRDYSILGYFGVYIGVRLFGETTILALGVIHGQIKGLGFRV